MRRRRYLAVVPTRWTVRSTNRTRRGAVRSGRGARGWLRAGSITPIASRASRHQHRRFVRHDGDLRRCVYDGLPLDGVSVSVEPGTERIRIASVTNFSGYRLRPDLTRTTLSNGTLITQDRGKWSTDGRLQILGRVDDQVITGGINVDLAELECACESWPGLAGAEVAVVAVPDARWGHKIVAVTNGSGSAAGLRSYLEARLPRHAAPRELVHLGALPRTAAGKSTGIG